MQTLTLDPRLAAPPSDHRLRQSEARQPPLQWLAHCKLHLPIGLELPRQKGAAGGLEILDTTDLRNLPQRKGVFLSLVVGSMRDLL